MLSRDALSIAILEAASDEAACEAMLSVYQFCRSVGREDDFNHCTKYIGEYGETLLHVAAQRGFAATFDELVKCGLDVNARDVGNGTPLISAAAHGHRDLVAHLCDQYDVDASVFTSDGRTAMDVASDCGYGEVVAELQARNMAPAVQPLNADALYNAVNNAKSDEEAMRAIQQAEVLSRKKHAVPMKLLLQYQEEAAGMTVLHLAVMRGYLGAVSKMLDAFQLDVHARFDRNVTPLIAAAFGGSAAMVQLLCERGADVNAQSDADLTPVKVALIRGNIDAAFTLYDHGAKVDADALYFALSELKSDNQKQALQVVEGMLELLRRDDMAPIRDDVLSYTDENGQNVLHIAAQKGFGQAVQVLVERGGLLASAQEPDASGRTPIDVAASDDVRQRLNGAMEMEIEEPLSQTQKPIYVPLPSPPKGSRSQMVDKAEPASTKARAGATTSSWGLFSKATKQAGSQAIGRHRRSAVANKSQDTNKKPGERHKAASSAGAVRRRRGR